jgi:hypothetical protein
VIFLSSWEKEERQQHDGIIPYNFSMQCVVQSIIRSIGRMSLSISVVCNKLGLVLSFLLSALLSIVSAGTIHDKTVPSADGNKISKHDSNETSTVV